MQGIIKSICSINWVSVPKQITFDQSKGVYNSADHVLYLKY